MDIHPRRGSFDDFRAESAGRAPGLRSQHSFSSKSLHIESSALKDEIKVLEKSTGEAGRLPPGKLFRIPFCCSLLRELARESFHSLALVFLRARFLAP
jgi:hypothetical protein